MITTCANHLAKILIRSAYKWYVVNKTEAKKKLNTFSKIANLIGQKQNKINVNDIYNTYPLSDLINLSVQKVQVLVKVLVLEQTLPDHL